MAAIASPLKLGVRARQTVCLAAYLLRPSVSLTYDVSNLANAPQVWNRGVPDQMQSTIINGVAVSVGLTGRF